MKYKIFDLSQPLAREVPWLSYAAHYPPPTISTIVDYNPIVSQPELHGHYDSHIAMCPHVSTHMDAPIHQGGPDQWTVDQIPIDRLFGEGVVVKIPKGELEEVTAQDLEKARPKIQKGDIVIINTGWHKHYVGHDQTEKNKYHCERYPALMESGAKWLRDVGVKTVGVDVLGVDGPRTWSNLIVHKTLYRANIPGVELIGGQIDLVPEKRCIISCAPPKYVRGDAFPVRVIVAVEEEE